MLRGENGITLVALIITIIILIILAAVTIMSFNESNLINTAVNSAVNYANAQKYEKQEVDTMFETLNDKVSRIESIQATIVTP